MIATVFTLLVASATVAAGEIVIDAKSKFDNLSPSELKVLSEAIGTRDRCTTIAVGPGATVDGSSMNTYNADCSECDWRVNKVPAKDWAPGSLRPVYQTYSPYPARVRNDRGHTWRPDNLEDLPQREEWETYAPSQTILGYIPQVNHTYALFEGMYSIMNEHQVGMGESTCAAKLWAAPAGYKGIKNGTALLEINELSQIALERSRTAREAIQVMGDLVMQYGYYSCAWDVSFLPEILQLPYAEGEAGEALTVIDPYEAWMFHILPDDTGTQAIWAAQRVPDDHITVCANTFVIREVDPDSDDFMYSDNLWSVAKKMGWWEESMGKLDFLKTYAPQRYHPNYSTKRVWRVFDRAAPSLALPFNTNAWGDDYPFSVKVDKKLSHYDLFNLSRDVYEGTPFDTTAGRAGGPYGDPNRWDPGAWGNMTVWDTLQGEFPRTISIFRTSYSTVNQARRSVPDFLSLSWLAVYAPDQSTYIPVYVNAKTLPSEYTTGAMHKYNTSSAWWNTCVVGNYVSRFYHFAIGAVRSLQSFYEKQSAVDNASLEERVMKVLTEHGVKTREETDKENGYVPHAMDSSDSEYSEHSQWLSDSGSSSGSGGSAARRLRDETDSDDKEEKTDKKKDKHAPLSDSGSEEKKAVKAEKKDKTEPVTNDKKDKKEADKKSRDESESAAESEMKDKKSDTTESDDKMDKKSETKADKKGKSEGSDASTSGESSSAASSGSDGSASDTESENIQDLIKRAEDLAKNKGKEDKGRSSAGDTADDDSGKGKGSDGKGESIQDLIKRAEDAEKKGAGGKADDSKPATDAKDSGKGIAKDGDKSGDKNGNGQNIQDVIKSLTGNPDGTRYGSAAPSDTYTASKTADADKNMPNDQYHHHHHAPTASDSSSDSSDGSDSSSSEPSYVKKIISNIENKYYPGHKGDWREDLVEQLTNHTVTYGRVVSESYRELLPILFATYRDGFIMNGTGATIEFSHMFYPMWWLKLVGYFDNKPDADGIFFASNPHATAIGVDEMGSVQILGSAGAVLALVVLGVAGFVMGTKYEDSVTV